MTRSAMDSAQSFSFGRGLAWLVNGAALLRIQAYRLLLMGLLLQFIGGFSQVGVLGLIFLLAMPAFTAGMLEGFYHADSGLRPPVTALFSAFRTPGRLPRFLALGSIMLICPILVASLFAAGSMAELDPRFLESLQTGDTQALENIDPELILRLAAGLLVGILIAGTLGFFAVPLVWFADKPTGYAINAGLRGMIMNWRPFLVLGLLLGMLGLPVALLLSTILSVSLAGAEPLLAHTLIVLLVSVIYQLVLFSTQYIAFKDIFGVGAKDSGPPAAADQLVA